MHGEVPISGAKNAALPELCAALLTAEPVTLTNVPRLQDVATMRRLLDNMGAVSYTHLVIADASALQQFDSSALAVLLACRRACLASGKTFQAVSYTHLQP